MPTTLVLRFPWGRYHANPWGRHVNEGAVELPPSPWRLLRALYAVWRTRVPQLDEDLVHGLLARLAQPPIVFYVPRHRISHTRHYYPDTTHRTGAASVDRTLDAFAVFERDAELGIRWDFDLGEEQRATLERLASAIPYFGRADSLCEGFVSAEWAPRSHETWTWALDAADSVAENALVITVLAPDVPLQFDSLLARPVDIRKGNLLFPAGTHLLAYQRSEQAPMPLPPPMHSSSKPTAVRFSVLQAGLPPQTDSLIYTDLLREAAFSELNRLSEERVVTQLGGRTADGEAMKGHGHAHFLPLLTDRRLTGLVVWVPNGLLEDELKALTQLDRLYGSFNSSWRLTVRVSGIGTPTQAAPELMSQRSATVWQSATPFTPSHYPKRSADWPDFILSEVTRELKNRSLPSPRSVTLLDEEWQPWRRYRPSARMRRNVRQGQASRPSAFLRIELTEPVSGPLALGHLSHFGLGLFLPARSTDAL